MTVDYLTDIPADWRATLAMGANKASRQGEWKNKTFTVQGLAAGLTQHTIGPKDGPCFLQGNATGGTRQTRAMEKLYIIGIDVDNGMPSVEIDEIIRERGLFCIRYTTHSHGKDYTEVHKNDYVKYLRANDGAGIAEYLIAKKRYLPEIATKAKLVKETMTPEGIAMTVSHPFMDKNRLIFVLAEPWSVHDYELQEDGIKAWKDAYMNFAAWLGIVVDKSCTDPARLFYLPRCEKGALSEAIIHQGKAVDIFRLPKAGASRVSSGNPYLDAAAAMGISDESRGHSLRSWAAKYASRFQIVQALEDHAPHIFRPEMDHDAIRHIECPFESDHTSYGGSGTFVTNAGEGTGAGFMIKCMHNACADRDRLDFLAEMISLEWLPRGALHDPTYLLDVEDEEDEIQDAEAVLEADEDYTEAAAEAEALVAAALPKGAIPPLSSVIDLKAADAYLAALAETGMTDLESEPYLDGLESYIRSKLDLEMGMTAIRRTYNRYAAARNRRAREAMKLANAKKAEAARAANKRKQLRDKEAEDDQRKARREASIKEAKEEVTKQNPRPTIFVDETDHLMSVATGLNALRAKNDKTPNIFRKAGSIARIILDEREIPRAEMMGVEELRFELCDVARYLETASNGGYKEVPATNNVVKHILADPKLPFPVLEGIVTAPIFGADGKINTTPGYDPSSCLYFRPAPGFAIKDVTEAPSEEEVDEALDLLLGNVLVDFPFDGPDNGAAERAHALAMILQPFARQLISGPTPIYLLVKPSPGTGASKLINIFSIISTGEEAIAQTETKSEDEMRKRIISVLLDSSPIFYLDNINYKIDSSSLASAVTAESFTDRLLGSTKTVTARVRHTWVFAGNNPTMSNEIARRCVRIGLDAKVERPELRTDFKHADLESWVRKNRSKLVWACLTLIQNWIAKGKPGCSAVKGSFEAWSRTIGGILESAGATGFLKNDSELREAADEEGSAIKAMLAVWWNTYREQPASIGGNGGCLFDLVSEEDIPLPIAGANEKAQKVSFGKFIKKLAGRIFTIEDENGERVSLLIKEDGKRRNKSLWCLSTVNPENKSKEA